MVMLPAFLVAENLAAGRLRRVLPGHGAGAVEILAIYPSRRLLEPRFIDLMVEALGSGSRNAYCSSPPAPKTS